MTKCDKIAMAMFLVSMETYDKGLLGNIWFKASLWIPDPEILVQNPENLRFLHGIQNVKFFEILFFIHICFSNVSVEWKFERKRN